MSELINNREFRKNTIKELLRMLHDGHDLNEVREHFAQAFSGVSPSEISEAKLQFALYVQLYSNLKWIVNVSLQYV